MSAFVCVFVCVLLYLCACVRVCVSAGVCRCVLVCVGVCRLLSVGG